PKQNWTTPTTESEGASPSFIISKKDSCVCWISNLCQLNKKFFTKLDIKIRYSTFELDEYSQELCTIITPFGKHKDLSLPMGLTCSPDTAQSIMKSVLAGIDDAVVYIDNVGAFLQLGMTTSNY
ncbi:hypothetical protein ACHAW6_001724, partial [Cyclotella cf. meneghiniana]